MTRPLRGAIVPRPGASGRQRRGAAPHGPAPQPVPEGVRSRMEAAFGADFSAVAVREGEEPAGVDALALTRGESITLRPGLGGTDSPDGLRVLAHELAHVVQQRAGRVGGAGFTEDPVLEAEADDAGERAARGEQVTTAPGPDGGGGAPAVTQPAGPLSRLKKAIAKRFGRRQEAALPPQAQAQGTASRDWLGPTEELDRLTRQAIAQTLDYARSEDGKPRKAAKAALDRTVQEIADKTDEYTGHPGFTRRLDRLREQAFASEIAAYDERKRVEGLFQPEESAEPAYFRTPGVGPRVHAPGTEPPYRQTPAPEPEPEPEYGLKPVFLRRSGE